MSTETPPPRRSIRFRGRSFLALVLAPEPPLADWLAEFDALIERSPGFFAGRPLVLDLSALPPGKEDDGKLMAHLAGSSVRVMAIEGRQPADLASDMPPIITGGREIRPAEDEPSAQQKAPAPPPPKAALTLESPVRSGQSVTYLDGDVIVVGSVGSGAEIVAGGSIHVCGTLRGRAIAGTVGNADARIFCRKLEAELLAIDGLYLTADGMDPQLRGRAAKVWLTGDTMMMTALD